MEMAYIQAENLKHMISGRFFLDPCRDVSL